MSVELFKVQKYPKTRKVLQSVESDSYKPIKSKVMELQRAPKSTNPVVVQYACKQQTEIFFLLL